MSSEQQPPAALLELNGDVVERQSLLNGTRVYTIAGEGAGHGAAWSWTLTLTIPREEGEPLTEGDLSLELDGENWEADLSGGEHHAAADDSAEAATIRAQCRFTRIPDAESSLGWPAAEGDLAIGFDRAELRLRPL